MKTYFILPISLLLLCTSCTNYISKISDKILDYTALIETKTSKYFEKDKEGSHNIISSAEFYGSSNDDFIPLDLAEIDPKITHKSLPQPTSTPGTKNSSLPSISSFNDPDEMVSAIFKKIYFHTNQYTPKDVEGKKTLKQIATYLKKPSQPIYFY